MANTYTQIYIQFVFAVQNRISLIRPYWEELLYKYITGITQKEKHKMIAINGTMDHIHLFIGLHPTQSVSDLVRIIKASSSKWVDENGFVPGRFQWQEGFGAFSYSKSHIDSVYQYVMNQKVHHKTKTFMEEYVEFLDKFEAPYDGRYVFHPVV